MNSVQKYREQIARIKTLTKDDSFGGDLTQYGVTEQYYGKIVEAVDALVEFCKKYLHLHRYYNSLSRVIEDVEDDDLKLCVLIDVMRCYEGLDHPASFTTPEGVALYILISRMYGIGYVNCYEDLREVDSSTISIIDVTPLISECSYEFGDRYSLFMPEILEKEDIRVAVLYRMLVYNLCKRIAEVDGEISLSEKEWLESIARIDDDDMTNDIDMSMIE